MNKKAYPSIDIKVNEKELSVPPDTTLHQLKNQFKPHADVIIYNGFSLTSDRSLHRGDEIVFIQKGEHPSSEEFECLLVARHSPGVHQKIKKSIVGIAGLGGLGSAVAIALARIGIGTLILVDFDVVEPSNLNRQQYFVHQIGMPKADALRENISKINPYVKVLPHSERLDRDNVKRIFKEAEVVVEAFDRAEEKAMLINVLSEKMPDQYIVEQRDPDGTVLFKDIHCRRPEDSRSAWSGSHGAESRNRCPPSSQSCFENPAGGRKVIAEFACLPVGRDFGMRNT